MNKIKDYIIIPIIIMVISISSCDKNEQQSETNNKLETKKELSVIELKAFFSKLINAKESDISYDEKTEQFQLLGIDQVSKSQLIKMYENSKK